MIDEKKLLYYIKSQINPYGKPFEGSVYDFGLKIMDYIENMEKSFDWIPCSDRMPENEVDVLIAYVKYNYLTGKKYYSIAMAFYEDGTETTDSSIYGWHDCYDFEVLEEMDCYIIPEGWWESVSFVEEFAPVDREVIAWMPLPEPYKAR